MGIISIHQAIDLLKKGEPVALPTETVYGLAAPINNLDAIRKVFEIKKRPLNDPLIVHVSDLDMAKDLVANLNEDFKLLAKNFWPGPLTLITKKNLLKVDHLITSNGQTVALRVPKSKLFLEAIKSVGPLAAPSANLFKQVSPSKASHVVDSLPGVAVVDGGDCDVGIESTILSVDDLTVLRPGMISMSELSKTLNKTITHQLSKNVPGSEEDHYQPITKVIVFKSDDKLNNFLKERSHSPLLLQKDESLVARNLYSDLRKLDQSADFITIKWSKDFENEKWMGIKNRLEKASSYWMD